jgi:hypothetical protein
MKICEIIDPDDPFNTWYSIKVNLREIDTLYSFVQRTSNNFNLPPEIFHENELLYLITSLKNIENTIYQEIPDDNVWHKKTKQLSDYLRNG